jgi:hypothetical protein
MRTGLLLAALLATSSAIAQEFHITAAYPSDSAGVEAGPRLGEPFWVTVQYHCDQTSVGAMAVSGQGQSLQSVAFTSDAGDRQATYGPLYTFAPQSMAVSVRVGDAVTNLQVDPSLPTTAIEYFNPKLLQASFGASLQFKDGQSSSVAWYSPTPPSFGFQQAFQLQSPVALNLGFGVLQSSGLQANSSFASVSSSVRINPSTLRTVGFGSLKSLSIEVKKYLRSETLVESNDGRVKSFVASLLPKRFDRSMSIYDAAQSLFRGTVSRLQYVRLDGARPSAVQALKSGTGDCGYFSALFTAACRQAGIPARPITGFSLGSNQWHVWAEFFVPSYGWIPVDPSYADGLDPQGSMALYFGVIPNLNQRVATAVGFDHSTGKVKLPILQSPYAVTDVRKVAWAAATCELTEVQAP